MPLYTPQPSRRLMVLAVVLCSVVGFARATPPKSELPHKRVLVLYSSGEEGLAHQTLGVALNETLQKGSPTPVDIYNEFTGLDRFAHHASQALLLDLYQSRYASSHMDLLVVVGPLAMDFVLRNRFLQEVPVVVCNVGDSLLIPARAQRPNLTAFLPNRTYLQTLELMLALFPSTRKIQVVLGASDYERHLANMGRMLAAPLAGRVTLEFLNDLPLEAVEARVRDLPDDQLVYFAFFLQDVSGRDFTTLHPLRRISAASRRPVFGLIEEDLGEGIVGGSLLSIAGAGADAGMLGLRILGGATAASIPLANDPGAPPSFDARQLERWGIPESRLPAGSRVRFRPENLWDTHWKQIVTVALVILAESILVVALVVQLLRRRRTERALIATERRFRTVAEFTHDWEFWQRLDGTFEYLSPSCERITGYPDSTLQNDPGLIPRMVEEEDRPRWSQHQSEALAGRCEGPFEFRIRTRAGALRWVEQIDYPVRLPDGQLAGNRGCIRDISERKLAELAMKQASEEIQALKDRLEAENTFYRAKIQEVEPSDELLGGSDAMKYLLFRVRQVAPSDSTVLILGETGTGKELVAEAVHRGGPRRDRPLVKVNCATLPAALAESELFGHERGAFTGAHVQRKGRFELADGATLFLDEVGELSLEVQAKLLRVLQNGEFQRVGGDRSQKVDVRVIAATNRDLAKEVAQGRFREDLWYRVNVFPITVPPLRNRPEDLPELATVFLKRFCKKLGRPELALPHSVVQAFQAYAWPGNVRELENVIERAVLVSEPTALRLAEPLTTQGPAAGPPGDLNALLMNFEREQIIRVLDEAQWKVEGAQGAARLLGMKPSTLRSRIARLAIARPRE